jgi:hypothetical protein
MFRLLRALPLTLALASLCLFNISCGSGSSVQARFVHAISDAAALDIEVNGTKDFSNVAFLGISPATGYVSVPSGNDTIAGVGAGGTTAVFSQSGVSLASGSQYTLIATGKAGSSTVFVMDPIDTNTAPANGNVNFRVINASPSGPFGGGDAVDVFILPNPTSGNLGTCSAPNCISNTAFKGVSSYVTLPYNSNGSGYTIYVTPTGTTNPIWNQTLTVGSASTGSIRTLILTDVQGGGSMFTLATVLSDLN